MSFTVWFTGLPCSGKTTLSQKLFHYLKNRHLPVHLLDGDLIRAKLPQPLSFNRHDRDLHGRRLGALSLELNQKGIISLVAAIAPYRETRAHNRRLLPHYVEVYCRCTLEVAESRDVRGLYARARQGQIPNFTGISDPYEEPLNPEVTLYTDRDDVETCFHLLVDFLNKSGLLTRAQEFLKTQRLTRLASSIL
jgi:adenylylsulfate kinase